MLHLKLQAKPKTSRRGEIIKVRAKINEIETKKPHKESTKQKAGTLKLNKIDKSLKNLTKKRREKTQIIKIRNKKGEITINIKEIQEITRDYVENLYSTN
jgi:hypothetical protein